MRRMVAIAMMMLAAQVFAHEHKAPHGGTLVEFGEEFAHLEIVLDKDGTMTAYALDGEAENPVRLAQKEIGINLVGGGAPIVLKAVASPLSGEKEGDTSQFSGKDAQLAGKTAFDASVAALTIKGKEFKDVKFNFPKGNEDKK